MCGIVGFIGEQPAAPILLEGLSKLEYRGYDSAGIAVRNEKTDKIAIVKAKGRLKILAEKTDNGKSVRGTCGIGHTRWATHGEPSENNAHPHCTDDKSVVLVHNGIIENYQELKTKLQKTGYTFYSQTDTEIAVKLIDYYYKKTGTPLEALTRAMLRIRGSYAFGVMFRDCPGRLFAARKDSPLIIEEIQKEMTEIKWDAESAEKGGYEHFMLKEIHEQPKAVQDTLGAYIKDSAIDFSEAGLTDEQLKSIERIYVAACGSAYHVGVVGKYVTESLAGIPAEVDLASEFRYRNPILAPNSALIVVSQSGETADSLAALRLAKEKGIPVIGIVNVVGSSIARESDHVLYTYAGPEISVATTKAYSAQLAAMYLLAVQMAKVKGRIDEKRHGELLEELCRIPDKIQKALDDKERIQWFASKYANAKDVFFIGRGIDYAISLEGSLKMKEISYIHSEAYAAGELKHGTISLIEDGILVVGVLTQNDLFEKTLSNMVEVKSRGAYLMGLTTYGNYSVEDTADFSVYVPKTEEYFSASLAIVPLQLMGYYVSVAKGLDVDKPRNLAKSVTVE